MTVAAKRGSFAANTTTGNQVISGLGFTPKVILFMTNGRTAVGSAQANHRLSIGAASSATDQWAQATFQQDNVASTNDGDRCDNSKCIAILSAPTTLDGEAAFVSMDTNGFTVNWTDAPASAFLIEYLALGGADLSAKAFNFDVSTALAGTDEAITGIGFQPKALLLLGTSDDDAFPDTDSLQTVFGLHAATSPTVRGGLTYAEQDNQAAGEPRSIHRQALLSVYSSASAGAKNYELELLSLDSDGFTYESTTSATTGRHIFGVALGGTNLRVDFRAVSQRTSTGTSNQNIGFKPRALFSFGTDETAYASSSSLTGGLQLGMADSTSVASISTRNVNAADPTDVSTGHTQSKFLRMLDGAQAVQAECNIAIDSAGYTLDWTTVDATARQIFVLTIGEVAQPVKFKRESFSANTSTGNQAITGVGFQPKAVIFTTTGLTSATDAVGPGETDAGSMFGTATDSTHQWSVAWAWRNATTPATTGGAYTNVSCIQIGKPDATTDAKAALVSMDSDGFTINWTDAPATAVLIEYWAIGGTGSLNAYAFSDQLRDTTGDESLTGFGFQPKVLISATSSRHLGNPNTGPNTASPAIGIGVATSASARGSIAFADIAAQNPSEVTVMQAQRALVAPQHVGGLDWHIDVKTFDSDGLTYTVTDAPAAGLADWWFGLALGGADLSAAVVTDTQKTSTGTQAKTGLGFKPQAMMVLGEQHATAFDTAAVTTANGQVYIGLSDLTTEASLWNSTEDNVATTNTDRSQTHSKFIQMRDTSRTVIAECNISARGSDGYTLDWTTADATARQFIVLALNGGEEASLDLIGGGAIASEEAFGTGSLGILYDLTDGGAIPSAQVFGIGSLGNVFTLTGGGGILSKEAFGIGSVLNLGPPTDSGHHLQTSLYAAALAFPMPIGITYPNSPPDEGNLTELVVPLTLTAYTPPSKKPTVNIITSSPIIDLGSNLSYGGQTVGQGARNLPTITLEGHMDTQLVADGSFFVPALVIDGIRHHYAEYIAMCIEGRFGTTWQRQDPRWFRDPYGRLYMNPIMLDFSANYVEGVPFRTSFTMRLMIPGLIT